MKRITLKEHRIDIEQIAYYHKSVSTIGGCHRFPLLHFYSIKIGIKTCDELSISCKNEEEQTQLIEQLDLSTKY